MKNNLLNIRKKQLNRVVTRDLPLFMVSASYGSHLRESTKEGLGYALSKNYVLFDQGTASVHRDNKEWHQSLPEQLQVSFVNQASYAYIRGAIDKTAESIKHFENYMQFFDEAPSNQLEELYKIILDGVPGMIFAHWVPIFSELGLGVYDTDTRVYFEESRKHIEKFFSLAADSSYLLLETLAKTHNIDVGTLKYATYNELLNLSDLRTSDLINIIKRKHDKLLFVEDLLFLGDKAINSHLEKEGYELEKIHKENFKTITGTPASNGKVRGKVQIIMSRNDFHLFEEGNILVAPMTSPEYTSLIHKASGIITDEGGLLSHAAIISRELRKPCLIATKYGTDMLEDFDLVELNADEGFVTLL